jgi:hypothetical protein
VDGYIPVRYSDEKNSILLRIIHKTQAEIKLNLFNLFTGSGTISDTGMQSTGSKKCDAYLWAVKHYINKTDPGLLFYTLDAASWENDRLCYPDLGNAFVFNHDYAIAKRAFVFDLSSYDDEPPCDDPGQPLGCDLAVMKEILLNKYNQTGGREMITVCGFNPWQLKYTDYKKRNSGPRHCWLPAVLRWRFSAKAARAARTWPMHWRCPLYGPGTGSGRCRFRVLRETCLPYCCIFLHPFCPYGP